MTVDNTLNLPVVQMGHVEKLVEVAQNQPHVQQLVAQQTVAQELKKQESQVPKTENAEKGRRVRDRDGDDRPGSNTRQHAQGNSPGKQDSPPEEEASPSTPWVGHLVNVKI